jgi:hypothetical protein
LYFCPLTYRPHAVSIQDSSVAKRIIQACRVYNGLETDVDVAAALGVIQKSLENLDEIAIDDRCLFCTEFMPLVGFDLGRLTQSCSSGHVWCKCKAPRVGLISTDTERGLPSKMLPHLATHCHSNRTLVYNLPPQSAPTSPLDRRPPCSISYGRHNAGHSYSCFSLRCMWRTVATTCLIDDDDGLSGAPLTIVHSSHVLHIVLHNVSIDSP